MVTCHHPVRKNSPTDTLNKNTTNTQDPRKGGAMEMHYSPFYNTPTTNTPMSIP